MKWRRYGDVAFALLVTVVITVEGVALLLIVRAAVAQMDGQVDAGGLRDALMGGILVSSLGLLTLTGFVLVYHAMSARQAEIRRRERVGWTDRWIEVLLAGAAPPAGPISRGARDALIDLRTLLKGEQARQLEELMQGYEIDRELLTQLSSHRLPRRLDALESLASAALPSTFDRLLSVLDADEAPIRLAAARASARTLSAMVPGFERERAAAALAESLEHSALPTATVQEAIVLTNESCPTLLKRLLERPSKMVLRPAIEAIGRLKLVAFAERIAPFAERDDPEIRAAVLRAFAGLGTLPERSAPMLLRSLDDPVAFVRVQAAHAACLLPPDVAVPRLVTLLTDPSWWTRKAAAGALLQLGDPGVRALHISASDNPDPYAREMAARILQDAGVTELSLTIAEAI